MQHKKIALFISHILCADFISFNESIRSYRYVALHSPHLEKSIKKRNLKFKVPFLILVSIFYSLLRHSAPRQFYPDPCLSFNIS